MASPLPPMPGETPQQRQARLAAADALQRQLDEERQAAMRRTMIAAPMAIPNYMPQGGLSVMDMGAAAMNSGPTAEQTARYLEALNQPGVIGGSWDADVGAYRMTARPVSDMAYPGGTPNFDESTGVYTPAVDPMRAFLNANIPMGDAVPTNGPGMFGGMVPPPTRVEEVAMDRGFNPVDWMNQPYTPVSPQPMPKPAPDIAVAPPPSMLPPQPMPAPTPDIVVAPRPSIMPTPPAPAFDPNQALNEYNAHLARIYQGGGQMDMDMIRAQQANLRDLQMNQQATAEQHDAGYRAALGELRNRYPDAFAG